LRERFEKLINHKSNISNILDLWETQGIDEAMKVFYSQKDIKPHFETISNDNWEDLFKL
jgi:hypothetical protein